MEEQDNVSGGYSSIPRSDLKIGGDELSKIQSVTPILNPGNTGHVSKDIEKANGMSQVGKVSESLTKHASSSKLGDVDCDRQALLKRSYNADAVYSCLSDDLSSVCSSRRHGKSSSMDVYSECGSSNVPVTAKDPMKLWKEMKQNGFISKPSSSCVVSSSHGGIPAPRKRGRKSKNGNDTAMAKKRKVEIARKDVVDRVARLAAPSGLLNELNPAIINHVRNKKQVLSIIENIVKSERDAGNFYHSTMSHTKNSEDVNTDVLNYDMPKDKYSMRYHNEKCANDEFREEDNTAGSRFQVSENVSSLSREDSVDLNSASVVTVKAATVASQWLELLHQDIKGRISALRRSKKRVRAVIMTELPFLIMKEFPTDQENDLNGASRASKVNTHKNRWITLFNQLEHKLSEEESQLECSLNQVKYFQSQCNQGLQHMNSTPTQDFLQLGMPLDSRAAKLLMSDKDLAIKASAACLFSTCNFLEEN